MSTRVRAAIRWQDENLPRTHPLQHPRLPTTASAMMPANNDAERFTSNAIPHPKKPTYAAPPSPSPYTTITSKSKSKAPFPSTPFPPSPPASSSSSNTHAAAATNAYAVAPAYTTMTCDASSPTANRHATTAPAQFHSRPHVYGPRAQGKLIMGRGMTRSPEPMRHSFADDSDSSGSDEDSGDSSDDEGEEGLPPPNYPSPKANFPRASSSSHSAATQQHPHPRYPATNNINTYGHGNDRQAMAMATSTGANRASCRHCCSVAVAVAQRSIQQHRNRDDVIEDACSSHEARKESRCGRVDGEEAHDYQGEVYDCYEEGAAARAGNYGEEVYYGYGDRVWMMKCPGRSSLAAARRDSEPRRGRAREAKRIGERKVWDRRREDATLGGQLDAIQRGGSGSGGSLLFELEL